MRYVIVGGGVAGTTAAEELRKKDQNAEITLISEEFHPLYSRVLLPHFMKEKVARERVFLKTEAWYQDQGIEWVRGEMVQKLDVKNKFVGCSNGREYEYDKLLLATGGEVRTVHEDMRGVSYFRTLDDADHFLQLVAERAGDAHGLIYGGGFIACEYLNLYRHFNIDTTIFYRGPYFWSRTLVPEAGELIATHLRSQGVRVMPNTTLLHVKGDKELTGVVTDGGEIDGALLGVGIGLQPDFSWLHEVGIKTNIGILSNEYLETNAPDVYTAGDVAEFFDPIVGRQMNVGNWMSAMMQGRVVAKSMAGERAAVNLVSSYATNALGLEMIFIGDVSREAADDVFVVGGVEVGGIAQVFERNGAVVGSVLINRNTDRAVLTQAIKQKHAFSELNLVKE